jgi:hypothetical protein
MPFDPTGGFSGIAPNPQANAGIGGALTNFLGNPLTQAALSAYLGTIGQPRRQGWGHAAMMGGLTGLEAFNKGREEQQALPLKQAELQLKQSQIPEADARTKYYEAQRQKIIGNPDANKQAGGNFRLMAQNDKLSPAQRAIADMMAPLVEGGAITADKAYAHIQAGDVNAAKIAADDALTTLRQGQASLIGPRRQEIQASAAQHQASAQKSLSDAALDAPRAGLIKAQTAHAQAGAEKEQEELKHGGLKPKLMTEYGPDETTREVSVAPTADKPYTPEKGWSLAKPGSKAKPDTATQLSKAFDEDYKAAVKQGNAPPVWEDWLKTPRAQAVYQTSAYPEDVIENATGTPSHLTSGATKVTPADGGVEMTHNVAGVGAVHFLRMDTDGRPIYKFPDGTEKKLKAKGGGA